MNSNWSYSPETPNLGQSPRFLEQCDLEIWRMTLKNNRAPLLSNIKLYASFHQHMWIQTGVTVRKRLSWVMTSVTLTFDLWPWPFAWTLRRSLVTRATRTPAFWGYPPPPHDYPHYWVMLDPKSKLGRMTLKILVKVKGHHMWHTFSC